MAAGKRLAAGLFAAAGVLVMSAEPAAAYIDPGTGSMIIQAVIAVIAAVGVALATFRESVASFFSRLFGGKDKKKD